MGASRAVLAALLFVSISSSALAQVQYASPPPLALPPIATKPQRTVCVMPYTALDVCGTDGTLDFTGYEPEVFKTVANLLTKAGHHEWAPGNWSFTCFIDTSSGYYDVINALNNGTCDVAMGGVEEDEIEGQPTSLSYSTYQSGRRIMIYRSPPQFLWVFLQPFETGVWLVMFGSMVVVALTLLLLEASWPELQQSGEDDGGEAHGGGGTWSWRRFLADTWQRYSNLQWATSGLMLRGVYQLSPRSPGGRIVALGAAFTSLLLACMYTSAYSALITTNNLKAQITSMNDLTTVPVGIFEGDEEAFKQFPLQNVILLPWNTEADEQNMLALLRAGTIAALVIDAPWADYQTSINCDIFEVGELVLPINMGFIFPAYMDNSYIINFDTELGILQQIGTLNELQVEYVRIKTTCPDKQPANTLYTEIRLHDVGGLWIILASCIGLGVLWNLLLWLGGPTWAWLVSKLRRRGAGGGAAHDDTVIQVMDRRPLLSCPPPPATVDEALLSVHRRLDKLDCFVEEVPRLLAAAMDQRLTSLRAELAVVIRNQMMRAATGGPGGTVRDSVTAPGSPGAGPGTAGTGGAGKPWQQQQQQQQAATAAAAAAAAVVATNGNPKP